MFRNFDIDAGVVNISDVVNEALGFVLNDH